jgi:protein-tyrosine phosphatase
MRSRAGSRVRRLFAALALLRFASTFPVLAEADLKEDEAGCEHQPDGDQDHPNHLADGAAEHREAHGAKHDEQRSRAERQDPGSSIDKRIVRQNQLISGYVDIHSHVLPGIDDGAPDLAQSLAMARAAAESGTSTLAATPHLHPDFPGVHVDELAGRCERLREELDREQIALELIPAAEVSLTWALDASDEQLVAASYRQGGHDLLIETPFSQAVGIERFLHHLRMKGYRITLAHPERNSRFQQDMAPLRELVEQGILLQLNADSLLGPATGRSAKRAARELLAAGLAHVIASDGHRGTGWRPVTRLAEAVEAAAGLVGPERARWMAGAAPAAIVDGTELPPAPAIDQPRRARRLFRIR